MKQLGMGKIIEIKKVYDINIEINSKVEGTGGRLGLAQMIATIGGFNTMDGYKITTEEHEIYVLISNEQNCCESWGYFSSDDDFNKFINTELISIDLTDKVLNNIKLKDSGYYEDCGGIQFVNFTTSNGVFQLAVYNAHNGYYGHGIIVAIDNDIMCNDTL